MSQTTLNQTALNSQPSFGATYNLLAYLYLAGFIILGMAWGFSPLIYALFLLAAMIFVLPSHFLGLQLIIFSTMIFERWFALQPLVTEYSIYKIYPLDLIIIWALVGWLINQIWRRKNIIIFGWTEKLLLAFMVLTGIYLITSLFNINADPEVSGSTFKNYAFYPLLYFLTIYSVQTKEQFKNILHLILFTGVLIIGFLVIGLFRGEGLWTEFTPLSTLGIRFLAGTHAFYLMIAALIALSLLAFDRFRYKGLTTLIIIVWLSGIALSLMRHLWLALLVGLIFILVLVPITNRKNLIKLSIRSGSLIITLIVVAVLLVNLFSLDNFSEVLNSSYKVISERIASVFTSANDTSINWRLNFWQAAKNSWLENPILGLGFGQKLPLELGDWQTFEEIRNIHNSPLAIAIQMGLIGITLFGLFLLAEISAGFKYIFKNEELKPYYLGLLAALTAIFSASLFQPYLETNLTGIFFWILLGLFRSGLIISGPKERI